MLIVEKDKSGAAIKSDFHSNRRLEPAYCKKRQKKVQTKKLVWGIGDIMKVSNDAKLIHTD